MVSDEMGVDDTFEKKLNEAVCWVVNSATKLSDTKTEV